MRVPNLNVEYTYDERKVEMMLVESTGYTTKAIKTCLEFLEPYESDDYCLLLEDEFVKETIYSHKASDFEFDYHEHILPMIDITKEDYGIFN